MSNYPPLRLAALNSLASLKAQMKGDPDFLESEDCPYDPETKALLHELLDRETVEVTVEKVVNSSDKKGRGRPSKDVKLSEEDQQAVLTSIQQTLKDLKEMAEDKDLDTSAKIQVAKTQTSLNDQLLKMQERHYSITRTQEFIETVIGILDELGDEKMREQMLARIDQFR